MPEAAVAAVDGAGALPDSEGQPLSRIRVVGMTEVRGGAAEQLLRRPAEEGAVRRVDLHDALVPVEDGHADGGVLEGRPEQLLTALELGMDLGVVQGEGGLDGEQLQELAQVRARTTTVDRAVDGQHPEQAPVGPEQRSEQGVHGMPGRRVVADLEVRDPAVEAVEPGRHRVVDEQQAPHRAGGRQQPVPVLLVLLQTEQLAAGLLRTCDADDAQRPVPCHQVEHRDLEGQQLRHRDDDLVKGRRQVEVAADPARDIDQEAGDVWLLAPLRQRAHGLLSSGAG